jgi:probable rRNA maturation factor
MTAAAKAAPVIDILVESTLWKDAPGATPGLRRAVAAAAAALSTKRAELAIVLTDDSAMRDLNCTWRGKDAPTNVLSFPAPGRGGGKKGNRAPRALGDIVIAYETTAREARAERKPFGHHLAHLAVHGYLHLAGHDHESDKEAEAMEALEIAILARLKVPNPYIARGAKG